MCAGGEPLAAAASATVPGPSQGAQGQQGEADGPTAEFRALPASHDGATAFTVELHFSENIEGLSYTNGGRRAPPGDRGDCHRRATPQLHEQPELGSQGQAHAGQRHRRFRLPARACTETNAVCVDGEPLAAAASATVPGTPFTGTFGVSPAEHDGSTAFHFHLSAAPAVLSYKTVKAGLFAVTGGAITGARRLERNDDTGWEVTVQPAGAANVHLNSARIAIEELEAPDEQSTSSDHEGRRILPIRGGWHVVNYALYREYQSNKQAVDAARQRRLRERRQGRKRDVSRTSRSVAPEAEAEAEGDVLTAAAVSSAAPAAHQQQQQNSRPGCGG